MDLPFLSKVFLPEGVSTPQYEALYQTILTYQADNDNTAQFFLASPADADGASTLTSPAIMDPMQEVPFDISIRAIKHHMSLSLPTEPPSVALVGPTPDSPGVSASTALEEIHCGIQSASGVFKLKRVWTKATSSGNFVELFAGHFTFNVTYGAMYKKAGYGTRQKHKWGFWAVRARTGDDGKEVGPRPMLPVSLHTNTETPPTHPQGGQSKQSEAGGLYHVTVGL